MGTTPHFAIPYPEPTDFVADGATQMEGIAEGADDALYALGMGRNRLINGDFRVAQRGTSFVAGANNDDTYNLDRWVLLSDGNDVVDVTQANTAPSGGLFSIGLDVETANKKFGILQIIEQRNIVGMFNQPVTLSFTAKTTGSSLGNLKAVILSWTGTADTVTSDVVSAWNADGVTPTWAANWTAENTPQNLAPSNDWVRYSITATLDTANINNVAVFIWSDDMTTTLADFLYITDVQLEVGALATPFERKPFSQVLSECQRYYWRITGVTSGYVRINSVGTVYNSNSWTGEVYHPVPMRVPATSLEGSNIRFTDRVAFNSTPTISATLNTSLSTIYNTNASFLNANTVISNPSGVPAILTDNASSYLGLSAEL